MPFSLLLSVYHKEQPHYLDQALFSIWDQQTLKPDEIVLVKDGSLTPELEFVIDKWKVRLGETFRTVSLRNNVGLGEALNQGLKLCGYDLVARMDTDDIAFPHRFEAQVRFMESNPSVVASSAQLEEWDEALEKMIGLRSLPVKYNDVLSFGKLRSPLSHPLAIFRKDVVLSLGGYPPLKKAQDYALWSLLLSRGYKLENLPDTLLKMRAGSDLFSRRGWSHFVVELELLNFQREIGFLSFGDYMRSFFVRVVLRLSPVFLKKIAYKYARR